MTAAVIGQLGRVGVIYGGTSAEREISLRSGAAVRDALTAAGVDVVDLPVSDDAVAKLQAQRLDRVFIAMHGPGGEDGTLQGALDMLGLPYTGSGVLASALAMDKLRSKQLWRGVGVPTAEFALLGPDTDWNTTLAALGGTAIVKPAHEGSSIGMSKVNSVEDLARAYTEAAQFDASVIAERWVTGAEYTVAILGARALPAIRLQAAGVFYDFHAKYEANDTRYQIPCGLTAEREAELQTLALQAFDTLGCRGWGRVDVMADADGTFQVLEVNTVPGMTDHSLVPMAANALGMSFTDLVVAIAATTLTDNSGESAA